MAIKKSCEVLVVGGGPVGLFAALCLSELGVEVQIVDRDQRSAEHAYGLALHGATLDLLDGHGLAQPLLELGNRVDRVALYRGESRAGELDLTATGERHPLVLSIPQSTLEKVLIGALRKRKVRLHWSHKLMRFEQDDDGVTAAVAKMDEVTTGYPIARTEWTIDRSYDVRAAMLIGADGYHSSVREGLRLGYPAVAETEVFAVFEYQDAPPPHDECRIVLGRESHNVHWPLPKGRGRWSFQVPRTGDDRPSLDHFRSLLASRAPWFEHDPETVRWSSIVRFDRRLAESAGAGRVWLAGDAMHLTSPVGVQSLNVGLREAATLAESVAAVVKNGAGHERLEAYGAARLAEWRRLLGVEPSLRPSGGESPWALDDVRRLLPCLPAAGEGLAALVGQLGYALD